MLRSKKMIIVACLGTVMEWAEFTFYAYIATTISVLFFPTFDKEAAMLLTFSVFAIGYFMRPLGAVIFGQIGDRYGRRSALQISIMLMGLSAIGIGLLPTYHTIGVWAPLLLLALRCLQGVAVSGEFNGASIFLMEHAKKHPTLAASWAGWAAALGMMTGSFMAMLVSLPSVPVWAWRIPFFFGTVICVCGVYLRRKFSETPAFLELLSHKETHEFPLGYIFTHYKKRFFNAFFLAAAFNVFLYVGNVFYVSYLSKMSFLTTYQARMMITIGTFLVLIFFPIMANWADRVGNKKVMRYGFSLMIITGPLLFLLPYLHSKILLVLGQLIYALVDAMTGASLLKYLNDLMPAGVRYSGVSFSWNLSTAIFSGTALLFSAFLEKWTHLQYAPGLYIVIAALAGLFCLKVSKKVPGSTEPSRC